MLNRKSLQTPLPRFCLAPQLGGRWPSQLLDQLRAVLPLAKRVSADSMRNAAALQRPMSTVFPSRAAATAIRQPDRMARGLICGTLTPKLGGPTGRGQALIARKGPLWPAPLKREVRRSPPGIATRIETGFGSSV